MLRKNKKTIFSLTLMCMVISACQSIGDDKIPPHAKAKSPNIILFVGDGMGVSTLSATRIFIAQEHAKSVGKTPKFAQFDNIGFENFPFLALVKTYNLDTQVSDSAGTASALNTGRKTQIGKINVSPSTPYAGCGRESGLPPTLFAEIVRQKGGAVGIVSTARLTHATPAAVYGHAKDREWENNKNVQKDPQALALECMDLARQLISFAPHISLGGGRSNFFDESLGEKHVKGARTDGRNLIDLWQSQSQQHVYMQTAATLASYQAKPDEKVLGLFAPSHMAFENDRPVSQPSLTQMSIAAVKALQVQKDKSGAGYFLMIEAGRIDHAHHITNAYRALQETRELVRAVEMVDEMTDDEDTLILVTADHSHVFTISGYPAYDNPILGLVHDIDPLTGGRKAMPAKALDGKPYTSLGYQNGPQTRHKKALTAAQVKHPDYQQEAGTPLAYETHGGEDVPLYAKGVGAQEVRGLIDQSEIFDIMKKAYGQEP